MSSTRLSGAEAIAYSAVENGSRIPIAAGELAQTLATGEGDSSHVRALFGDVSLSTLMQLAIEYDISDAALARAYANARRSHAASNPELDDFAAEQGIAADRDPAAADAAESARDE
jgi:hypothetical protein